MASLAKRKQKVNQLRQAHFPFGFESNKDVVSQYCQEYPGRSAGVVQPIGDRRSHFTIASDQPNMGQNTYQSEFKQQYPQHPTAPQPPAKRLNDANNIVFGFQSSQPESNYKADYLKKQASRCQPVNQRAVHIELGDTLTDFTTSYNKNYDGAQAAKNDLVDNNARESNLVFGYGNTAYQTSNNAAHNAKPIAVNRAAERSYGTNVILGGDGGNYHSEQRSRFPHKEVGYQAVDKNRVKDFRSAHFQMGFPQGQVDNVSQAQAKYNAKPLMAVQVEGRKPTNIELKHDENKYFQSSYGDHFQQKPFEKNEALSKDGRKDNVIIGMGNERYNSEAKDQFVSKPIQRVTGKGQEGTLDLGDGTRNYETMYRNTFTNKHGIVEQTKITNDDISKMKEQHIVKGFSGPDYKLHSMKYGQPGGQTNKLTRQMVDKMRTTNVVYGDGHFEGKTIHASSYGWKKNDDF